MAAVVGSGVWGRGCNVTSHERQHHGVDAPRLTSVAVTCRPLDAVTRGVDQSEDVLHRATCRQHGRPHRRGSGEAYQVIQSPRESLQFHDCQQKRS